MTDDKELIARMRRMDTWLFDTAADRIEQLAVTIEALTEQLAAARDDAKAAEDELEMQEQEACMMENDYIKLEKERDALEAKLAKAVEGFEVIRDRQYYRMGPGVTAQVIARATLAKIKGESHE